MADRPDPTGGASLNALEAVRELRDHPALPGLIPALPPRTLARLYDMVGRNDAGSLMALTPTALLVRALDEAVWTRAGAETRFDADAFVDWLEVWLGEGEAFAAERLLALDEDMLALCFSEIVRVEDSHVTAFSREADDAAGLLNPDAFTAVFDRFLVTAALDDEWEVAQGALLALWSHDPDRLLALLERLTACEASPETARASSLLHLDAAAAREDRQEGLGYVAPAAAEAFLAMAHVTAPDDLLAMTAYDLETSRHLSRLRAARRDEARTSAPPPGATGQADAEDTARPEPPSAGSDPEIWTLLHVAGIVDAATPAGLLTGPAERELVLRQRLDRLAASEAHRQVETGAELAYLANVLLAVIDLPARARRREDEARELAFATASLGLELLESRGLEVILGEPPGLIRPFLVAWRTLAELPRRLARALDAAFAAPAMTQHLEHKRWLRAQMLESLDDLREAVGRSQFDAARESLALLSLACQTDACRAASHLLGRPPRFSALLEGGDRHAARWMRSLADLERVAELLTGLGPKA